MDCTTNASQALLWDHALRRLRLLSNPQSMMERKVDCCEVMTPMLEFKEFSR
jgi:hypothetical protein